MEDKRDVGSSTPGTEASAAPRVLRELLKTPAVKELLALNLKDADPETARELARGLLWEDSVFSFGMLGRLPHALNFLTAFLDELGRQLQNLPPHLLREFAAEMVRNLDQESMSALPRAYAPLLNTLLYENPQALGELITSSFVSLAPSPDKDPAALQELQERKIKFLQEAIKAADFGKIRTSIEARAGAAYPVTESVITALVSDPIIFANLINIIPPLVNNLLKGLSKALAEIDFPPEILASAVFNLLDDLQGEELGAIINSFSGLINSLHEGSAVLGRGEPRFRPVLQNLLDKATGSIDAQEAAGALLALMEDSEVILCALADTAAKKPEFIEHGFSALIEGFNAQLRGLTYLVDKLNQLPPHYYRHFALELNKKDFAEAGNLLNSLLLLSNRVLQENPGLVKNAFTAVYSSLDKDELSSLLHHLFEQGYAFVAEEKLLQLIKPEQGTKTVNALLKNYNRKLEQEPRQLDTAISFYLDHLDREELSKAVLLTSGRLSQTLTENPVLARSLLKSFIKIVWGVLRGSLRRKVKTPSSPPHREESSPGRQG